MSLCLLIKVWSIYTATFYQRHQLTHWQTQPDAGKTTHPSSTWPHWGGRWWRSTPPPCPHKALASGDAGTSAKLGECQTAWPFWAVEEERRSWPPGSHFHGLPSRSLTWHQCHRRGACIFCVIVPVNNEKCWKTLPRRWSQHGPTSHPGPSFKGPAKIGLVAVLLPMSLLLTEGAGRDLSKDILDGGPGRPPGPGDTIHDPGGRWHALLRSVIKLFKLGRLKSKL